VATLAIESTTFAWVPVLLRRLASLWPVWLSDLPSALDGDIVSLRW